jgi:hypothetical protein
MPQPVFDASDAMINSLRIIRRRNRLRGHRCGSSLSARMDVHRASSGTTLVSSIALSHPFLAAAVPISRAKDMILLPFLLACRFYSWIIVANKDRPT